MGNLENAPSTNLWPGFGLDGLCGEGACGQLMLWIPTFFARRRCYYSVCKACFCDPFLGLEMRRFCLADPFSGPENGLFFGPRNYTKTWQVASFWRSASYLANKFSHQDIVWINVDETCVACSPACPTGCVVGAHCWKTHPANAHMRVKKDTSRKTFTYVAMIASRPCIQAALPHFLVCSESRMPKLVARAFKALPPSRLQLLRGKSSWVTAETFVTILTELQKALQPWLPAVKPILLLDCACPHLRKKCCLLHRRKGCSFPLCHPVALACCNP